MSFVLTNGARRRALRLSLVALFALGGLAHAEDKPAFNSVSAISPSLFESRTAPFEFSTSATQSDAVTAYARDFSRFHFDQKAHQRIEAAVTQIEKRNEIDVAKVAALLKQAKRASAVSMAAASVKPVKKADEASARIAKAIAPADEKPVVMAFASPAPTDENEPLAAIASVAPADEDTSLASLGTDDDESMLPESVMIPEARPDAPKAIEKPEKPAKPQVVQDDEPSKPGARPAKPEKKVLALAKPETDDGKDKSFGQSLRNIFGGGGKRAGNGVAVYDISAAKVYMPDGTVLRAHSGIGKMADNPKYQHVKMNGPTPAHTYNLRMRERRFHGVEAIRMLPVDGRNKYGRDGFLTHSMLLRGRPNQSHGCVAFADYNKFLSAFKKGKVKQLVVVASGGRAVASR